MDGFDLAAEFERQHPDCRVLLMSAGLNRTPKKRSGVRVVSKASVQEEAFKLLENCRQSEVA
jgi:hypothetical protein